MVMRNRHEALSIKLEEQAWFGRKKQQDGSIKWMALGAIQSSRE